MNLRAFCCSCLLISAHLGTALGDTIIDRFRADGGFNNTTGAFVKRFDTNATFFTVPTIVDYRLDHIDLPLRAMPDTGTASLLATISLREDSGGVPGNSLETFSPISITAIQPTFASGTFHLDSTIHPILEAGHSYWLAVDYTDAAAGKLFWFQNVINDFSSYAEFHHDTGNWFVAPNVISLTARIQGTPVPEPSSLLLGCLGAILLSLKFVVQKSRTRRELTESRGSRPRRFTSLRTRP